MNEMSEMIEAVEVCLQSLDPKKPKRFNKDELKDAQEKARQGLALALAYLRKEQEYARY